MPQAFDLYAGRQFFGGLIIFNKPFAVISNSVKGNARFDSLLSLFHLEDRMVDIAKRDVIPDATIKWTEVNDIVDRERRKSLKFLKQNLDDNIRMD